MTEHQASIDTVPRELGFRMPAEWEPHAATWLSWPHNRESWPGKFESILPTYARMVAAIAASETVHIDVNDADMERQAKSLLRRYGARGEIHFHPIPTDDAWCRDHGAVFITRPQPKPELAAVDWQFNAWGNKYPHDRDKQVARQIADTLRVPCFHPGMILEGGAIDVNGSGDLLTTEQCLLHPNRNQQFARSDIEQRLRDYLGVSTIHWLGSGIEGDDTDGHVDDIARFVSPESVVTVAQWDEADANHLILSENVRRLRSFVSAAGKPFHVIELPSPPAIHWEGRRLPASYANFYIANRCVLLPGYGAPSDHVAQGILSEQFPGREVVVLDCSDLVWGLGAFHCLTQQVPAIAST